MSDAGSDAASVEQVVVDSLPAATKKVLKNALAADGLVRGLHEAAKAIDAGKAQLVFLSSSCDEPTYKKLVKALCLEKQIPLIEAEDSKKLGEWAGLCKIDEEGKPRKIVKASCVVITDVGDPDDDGFTFIQDHIRSTMNK